MIVHGSPAPPGCTCATDDEGCLEVFQTPDGQSLISHYFFDPDCPHHGTSARYNKEHPPGGGRAPSGVSMVGDRAHDTTPDGEGVDT